MIAQPASFRFEEGLGVLQLATSDADTFRCIPGDAALASGQLKVMEVSEGGSVNTLAVLNSSGEFVFLMDGDVLEGAKQNRVVNTSILLAPTTKTRIPVSCVEAGRWRYTRRDFTGASFTLPSFMRRAKAGRVSQNLRDRKSFQADQHEVWNLVSRAEMMHDFNSDTASLSDVYASTMDRLNLSIASFAPDEAANGCALFLGNALLSVDIFNGRDLYRHYFPKILRAGAFEKVRKVAGMLTEAEARFKALDLLDSVEASGFEEYDGVGAGKDRRHVLEGAQAFQLRYGEVAVHLCAFREDEPARTSSEE